MKKLFLFPFCLFIAGCGDDSNDRFQNINLAPEAVEQFREAAQDWCDATDHKKCASISRSESTSKILLISEERIKKEFHSTTIGVTHCSKPGLDRIRNVEIKITDHSKDWPHQEWLDFVYKVSLHEIGHVLKNCENDHINEDGNVMSSFGTHELTKEDIEWMNGE